MSKLLISSEVDYWFTMEYRYLEWITHNVDTYIAELSLSRKRKTSTVSTYKLHPSVTYMILYLLCSLENLSKFEKCFMNFYLNDLV